MSCLHAYVPRIFSEFWVVFITLWIVVSQVVNCYMIEEDYFLAVVLEMCGFVVVIGLLCRWTCGKVKSFSIYEFSLSAFTARFTADDFTASLYVYSYLLILIFQNSYYYHISGFTKNWPQVGSDYLCMYAISVCVYVVVITVLPGHVSRAQGRRLQHDLDIKHQYVQHMAHHLVEPIDVIDRGLHALSFELDEANVGSSGMVVASRRDTTESAEANRTNFKEYQYTLKRTSGEMNRILKNLLEDTVQVAAVVDVVQVGEFIKDACTPFAYACSSKNLRFNVLTDCQESCLTRSITIDGIKLTQALRELVSNSIKFTAEGGAVTITATILSGAMMGVEHGIVNALGKGRAMEQFLLIKLVDTGEGISPEILECMFNEPIKKTNLSDKLSKGGMSLMVVKNIVELHEGFVWVESEGIGFGSTVLIQLPVLDAEVNPHQPTGGE